MSGEDLLWLQLRKDIPEAEEDEMTLQDFRALTKEDLLEVMETVKALKRGKLRRLYTAAGRT